MRKVIAMFDIPDYSFGQIFFTGVGVLAIWTSWGPEGLSLKYLRSALVQIGIPSNWLLVLEFIITMFFGVIFAVVFVNPQTASQAIAAGMGWTSFVTKPAHAEKEA